MVNPNPHLLSSFLGALASWRSFLIAVVLASPAFADLTPPGTRTPKYPPKTARMIHTDADIATMRANVEKYPAARKLADGTIANADKWAAWSDEDLVNLVTTSDVTRAFETGPAGCPICGPKIYVGSHANYAWIIDVKKPFKVQCPSCKTLFPTNDYESYYRSGMKEKKGWDTKYVDDGWGYKGPDGTKYWFVAYWNHWMWHAHMTTGVQDLGRAYILTGDKKYAHKAAVLLHRIAQVYPAMDHENQSRYGEMMKARGAHYPGKVVNLIWETGLISKLAESYDSVWETIPADEALQKQTGKSAEQIRSYIEANLLEDGIEAVFDGKIRGNFGMHQKALMLLSLARQTGENEKWYDYLMNNTGDAASTTGLSYALYNLVYRDGLPSESSPGYDFLWVSSLANYGSLLEQCGVKVFSLPKTRRLFDGVLDQVVVRQFTPALGDTLGVFGGMVGGDVETFSVAYAAYKDPRYATMLAKVGGTGDGAFKTFESLTRTPIDKQPPAELPPQPSRLLDGFGWAFLNDPKDTSAVSLYYGQKHGHGHFDRLAIDLFANKRPMLPDLGYPDAMNDFQPGIFTWSKNTISHNTVTVDARRQPANVPGTVKLFADSPFARFVDVDAGGTYPQCPTYRRAVTMIDAGDGRSYLVDVFTVAGGKQHDYSLHGPPGEFEAVGGQWSSPAPGTLAGPNVAIGQIYDDPKLGAKDYKGGYSSYSGSGFQHLYNVRRHEGGEWLAQYAHEKDPSAKLRIRVLPQNGQQILLADARVSPVNHPEVIRYVIARTQSEKADLASRFVSVIEPYTGEPIVKSVKQISPEGSDSVILEIERTDGNTDVAVYNPTNAKTQLAARKLTTDAAAAVVTYNADGAATRAFFAGGTSVSPTAGQTVQAAPVAGKVTAIDPATSTVRVAVASPTNLKPEALVGRAVHFTNDLHRTAHTVAEAKLDGSELTLRFKDDLLIGRARVSGVKGATLATKTALPLLPTYVGAAVSDPAYKTLYTVASAEPGAIALKLPDNVTPAFKPGDDVWFVNVQPGDTLDVPATAFWIAK